MCASTLDQKIEIPEISATLPLKEIGGRRGVSHALEARKYVEGKTCWAFSSPDHFDSHKTYYGIFSGDVSLDVPSRIM